MITIEKALELIEDTAWQLPPIDVELEEARRRTLAADTAVLLDLPPFDQSAMDGVVVRSDDLRDARPNQPVKLRLVGTSVAGEANPPTVASGTAARVTTGGPIPPGADAVVPREDVQFGDDDVTISRSVAKGAFVRIRGEEVHKGELAVAAGTRLDIGALAALAIAGHAKVPVRRKPKVAYFVTGDEIVSPGSERAPHQVFDGNGTMLRAWCRNRRVELINAGRLPDSLSGTREAIAFAMHNADLVITTGGVSVGDRDFVRPATQEAGGEQVFWKVAQKPGKPIYFARHQDENSMLLGLPGNPAAVFVGLHVFADAILARFDGREPSALRTGMLTKPVRPNASRDQWVRCARTTNADGLVGLTPLDGQESHMISNLVATDALVRIPAGEGDVAAGTRATYVAIH